MTMIPLEARDTTKGEAEGKEEAREVLGE